MEKVVLGHGRGRSLERRHPWVFSGAVASAPENAAPGDTVAVADASGDVLGYGSWSPQSRIRVRMLSFDPAVVPDAEYVSSLAGRSVRRRLSVPPEVFGADAVASGGAAMRLVNAESDLLPGVVADFYAGWAVCQFTSAGADRWKREIAGALMREMPGCRGVAERLDADARRREGLPEGGFAVLAGEPPPERIEICERGIRYLVDVRAGHKTGFYLDQRDARAAVGAWTAEGMDVLNCFCYTGGFGLCAAAHGAKSVTQVDASADALALARLNAGLNGLDSRAAFSYEAADVFKFLRLCRDSRRTFDMIVLDPPKFAETRSQVARAARGYKDINLLAMKLLRPGGLLASFSCSGAMDGVLFEQILAEAAQDAGRDFQTVARTGHAADHPVALSFPEGRYLKGVLARCM